MQSFNNVLLISGSGKKVGKTTLACRAIDEHRQAGEVIGIKCSPHFHALTRRQTIVFQCDDYVVSEELNRQPDKDSARFLHAGAARSFYIQAGDVWVKEAFLVACEHAALRQAAMVVESGGLASHIAPGLHVFVIGKQSAAKATVTSRAHLSVHSDELGAPELSRYIKRTGNCWHPADERAYECSATCTDRDDNRHPWRAKGACGVGLGGVMRCW